jgi:hypothetical protein
VQGCVDPGGLALAPHHFAECLRVILHRPYEGVAGVSGFGQWVTTTLTRVAASTKSLHGDSRPIVTGHAICPVLAVWGSGSRGDAAAAPWWTGCRRAGGHRLFTANDRERTGTARFLSGVRDR